MAPRGTMFRWALWFISANALVLMLVFLYFLKSMPIPTTHCAQLFLGLSFPGHCFSLALCPLPFLATAILVYPRRGIIFSLGIFLESLLLLLIVVDFLVFAQYRFHLNGMVWNLITSGSATDVLPFTRIVWLAFFAALAMIGSLQWALVHLAWRWVVRDRRRYGLGVSFAVFVCIFGGNVMYAWASANSYTPITNEIRFFPGYQPLTMRKLLIRMGLAPEKGAEQLQVEKGKSSLNYPLQPLTFAPQDKKMNLLLIAIESWRFDSLTPDVTPNLAKFAGENLRFENHFSSGNCTRFGIFGLFYGMHGTYWHSVLAEERSPLLMQELEKRAYRMGIFASAPLINPEFHHTVFSDIRSRIDLRQEGDKPYQRDRTITDKMVRFLAEAPKDSPFFGFMFYDSPHAEDHPDGATPFQPALKEVNHLVLNNDYNPLPYLNKYRNSLHYVDSLVQEVLSTLSKRGMLENTIVVITGDHGQEFNDLKLNYWEHNGNFARYQTQVPLVIHWPGKEPHVYRHVTSHVDLAPTLMHEMLGCQSDPSTYSNGRYLSDRTPRPYIVSSSWDTFGIIERDRIMVSLHAGEVDILDTSYRPLQAAQMRPHITENAMEDIGKFYMR